MSGHDAKRRDLLKALGSTPAVMTLPSGVELSQFSISPVCMTEVDQYMAGLSNTITASCLTSLGVDAFGNPLLRG